MTIEGILEHNRRFVAEKGYERFITDKFPDKKLAIVTCMDTRLTELLLAALGLRNGDAKIIKNAGGTVLEPFSTEVRSLLVGIYELGVEDIMVVGHTDCGAQHINGPDMVEAMRSRGISQEAISLLERGGGNPTMRTLERLARALGRRLRVDFE